MSDLEAPSYAFPETVLAQEVSGEMVLLDLQNEQYYGLDRVGADMVVRLTRQPKDDAIAALCRDYEADAGVLRRDLDALVDKLMGAGLLVRITPR
jgi:hypothetical protein